MDVLLEISWILITLTSFFTFLNFFTVRVPHFSPRVLVREKVSILVPLRNEAENVEGVIHSLIAQQGVENFEILALDDSSSDQTLTLLQDISAPNLTVLNGENLPTGWLGKNFACHQLATRATGDYLVFVDADVRLAPTAIAAALQSMKKWNWDFLSPYPRQIAITFLERLAQPLLQWSWFASLPLRIAERMKKPSMVVANGQFFAIKRRAYFESGGHAAIKTQVIDDLELGRSMVRQGFRGGVAEASALAECRMYSNSRELIEGYTKSQWRAFRNPFGALTVSAILFLLSIYPFVMGLTGNISGWLGFFAVALSRVLVAIKTRSVVSSALLHPISAALWIYLILLSWIRKSQGQLSWRGRQL
jgi:glycosyltransferase involved in cell wall biosynthesis